MSAIIAIEGRRDGSDVNSFSRPSVVPIIVSSQYLYVALPKVVVGVRCMLHYCRFKDTRCCLGSGEMLLISGRGSATRFPDIILMTGTIVTSCACVVVDYAIDVKFIQFVFWVDQVLPQCASGANGGGNADFVERAGERLCHSRVVGENDMASALGAIVVVVVVVVVALAT